MPDQAKATSNRGFAAMSAEKQREIASKGGKAAHQSGKAHEFTSEEAREAGRKGGYAVSQNREHMSEIGRRGRRAATSSREARESMTMDESNGDSENFEPGVEE